MLTGHLRSVGVGLALMFVAASCGGDGAAPSGLSSSTVSGPAGSEVTSSTQTTPTTVPTTNPPTTTSSTTGSSTTGSAGPTSTIGPVDAAQPCESADVVVQMTGSRSFRVVQPDTDIVLPVVIVLHGFTGSPEAIEATSGWTEVAADDAVLVYPRGRPVPGREGFGWAAGTDRFSIEGDDVDYLWGVYQAVVREHCGDPRRVLLTGESNGAAMAVRAACAGAFAGAVSVVAPVIPAIDGGAIVGCAGAAVALVAIASHNDTLVPFEADSSEDGDPLGQLDWFTNVATRANGCASVEAIEGGADHNLWKGVDCARASVLVGVLDGAGHTWPGGPVGTGGLDPGGFPATNVIWDLVRGGVASGAGAGAGAGAGDGVGDVAAAWNASLGEN